jgi:uncharacterized membrane protein YqjE
MNPESQDFITDRQIGLLGSLKTLASTLLGIGCTRLELLSNEVEEQRVWLSSILIWTFISLFCAAVGVVLVAIFLVVVFWDTHRLLTLSLLASLFLLGAMFSLQMVRDKIRAKPKLFSASLAELAKDREQLTPPPPP